MQKNKKAILLMISLMISQCAYSSQSQSVTETTVQPQNEEYIYAKNVTQKPANLGQSLDAESIVLSDNTSDSYLTTAKTRTRVTQETKNGTIITTTETWTTKNPSYFTKINTALFISAVLAGATVASIAGYSLLSMKRYITESPEEIVKNINPALTYSAFMKRMENNSISGVRQYMIEYCSTAGMKFDGTTSETKVGRLETGISDLYERNKALIATHAYDPFEVTRLVKENMMLSTFQGRIRQVEAQSKKEWGDIGANTSTADVAKGALAGAATVGGLAWLNKKSK
jgi:hypothetical protein